MNSKLDEIKKITVTTFIRGDDKIRLPQLVAQADAVVHLAGENRPKEPQEFARGNIGLTEIICQFVRSEKRPIKIIF